MYTCSLCDSLGLRMDTDILGLRIGGGGGDWLVFCFYYSLEKKKKKKKESCSGV